MGFIVVERVVGAPLVGAQVFMRLVGARVVMPLVGAHKGRPYNPAVRPMALRREGDAVQPAEPAAAILQAAGAAADVVDKLLPGLHDAIEEFALGAARPQTPRCFSCYY